MDGQSSHITDDFLIYCWVHKIVPFLLPPHLTHLLQPLDIGIFQPLKHWHQEDVYNTIQYGDVKYDKIDFVCVNGYQQMRNRTFKKKTILYAFEKAGLMKAGRIDIRPEEVLNKTRVYFNS